MTPYEIGYLVIWAIVWVSTTKKLLGGYIWVEGTEIVFASIAGFLVGLLWIIILPFYLIGLIILHIK